MLMAGLDGIKNQIDPGDEDRDLFELAAEELKKIPTVPVSLNELWKHWMLAVAS